LTVPDVIGGLAVWQYNKTKTKMNIIDEQQSSVIIHTQVHTYNPVLEKILPCPAREIMTVGGGRG